MVVGRALRSEPPPLQLRLPLRFVFVKHCARANDGAVGQQRPPLWSALKPPRAPPADRAARLWWDSAGLVPRAHDLNDNERKPPVHHTKVHPPPALPLSPVKSCPGNASYTRDRKQSDLMPGSLKSRPFPRTLDCARPGCRPRSFPLKPRCRPLHRLNPGHPLDTPAQIRYAPSWKCGLAHIALVQERGKQAKNNSSGLCLPRADDLECVSRLV